MQYLTPGTALDNNPGSEHMLKKIRWALEGKSGTQCDGNWVRDNASVAVIVATDEGHQCPSTELDTCSIDNFKKFRDNFSHNLRIYANLTKSRWTADETTAFSHSYEETSSNPAVWYGHDTYSFYNFAFRMLDDVNFMPSYIYSPLDPHPNAGTVKVKVKRYSTDSLVSVEKCSASVTASCYKELPSTQAGGKGAVQLVEYGHTTRNFYYDGKNNKHAVLDGRSIVTVEWESGGNQVGGQPFVSSWTLDNDPLPDAASMTVIVTKDGMQTTLTRGASNGYTLNGRTISVASADVKQIVPQGAQLKVTYKENTALKKHFDLGSDDQLPANARLVPGSERVRIIRADGTDGPSLSSGFSFDGGKVIFDSLSKAPAEGESFSLFYKYTQQTTNQHVTETIITDYSYTKSGNTDTSRNLSCSRNGSSVGCSYTPPAKSGEAGTISFSGNLSKGDMILVTEYLQRSGSGVSINSNIRLAEVGLSNCEMDEAVEMQLGNKMCSTLGASTDNKYLPVTSSGMIELLSADACGITSDILTETNNASASSKVVFRCKKVAELPDDFLQMRKDFFEMHRGKYKFEYWQIMVNGQELQLTDSSDLLIQDYKIIDIKGVDTSDAGAMRELLGGNDKSIRVIVRLFEAL